MGAMDGGCHGLPRSGIGLKVSRCLGGCLFVRLHSRNGS